MRTQDLVIRPQRRTEEKLFEKYSGLLDVVCGEGLDKESNPYYFQREAVRCVFDYMLRYGNLGELIKEHIKSGGKEYDDYHSQELGSDYLQEFRDKDKKVATIDLPTGTGKSFVIFAVAIMLYNEIDEIRRIQVIVPSKTISRQLREKFEDLLAKVGRMQEIKLPTLTSLHEDALEDGTLAIDNIHRFYETQNAQLAKEHSFGDGKGADTLLLNDEAHHIYNAENSIAGRSDKADLRKWLDFVLSPEYNFKHIVNFTATPFEKQSIYLHNVIYRYGLTQAIEDRIVKNVRYLAQGTPDLSDIKVETQQLELAIQQLKRIKKEFKTRNLAIKPFGVVVCDSIAKTDEVVELMRRLGVPKGKIIAYTSKEDHLRNEALLAGADQPTNPIEWVVSVGMLTEGWDAKNVFVLVPHEERAFASKLLISQMVGRGLRRIEGLADDLNEVLVLNHKAWGDTKIRMLVNDIVDVSPRIEFGATDKYHFEVKHLHKVYADFNLQPQESASMVSFKNIVKKACKVFIKQDKYRALRLITKEIKGDTAKGIPAEHSHGAAYWERENIIKWYEQAIPPNTGIRDSFDDGEDFVNYILGCDIVKQSAVKDKLHRDNLGKIEKQLQDAFNRDSDIVQEERFKYEVATKNTQDMQIESMGTDTFLRNYEDKKGVWYSPDTFDLINSQAYKKLVQQQIHKLPTQIQKLPNATEIAEGLVKQLFREIDIDKYKTPLEIVAWDSDPEYMFIEQLLNTCMEKIDVWVKSRTQGFYTIDCPVADNKPDIHFNPDFILRSQRNTLIIEIKSDRDISMTNAYKLKGLTEYLKILNKKTKRNRYCGYMLRPKDYPHFFAEVIEKRRYDHVPKFHIELENLS